MRIFHFSANHKNSGICEIFVIAHDESEARDLIADYDIGQNLDPDDFILIETKFFNKGILAYIVE